jgi:choline dehydrogenase-like flavoprotein
VADETVVVIGSGPCGATAAAWLARRGVRVTMLDAGAAAPRGFLVRAAGHTIVRRKGWAEYLQGRQDPASDPAVEWYSSLSLGGLSNYWTAAVPRLAPEDFTDGARLDERYRWPVTYEDLVPFYDDVERMLGVTTGAVGIRNVPANCARRVERLPLDWAEVVDRAAASGEGIGALPMAKGDPWMVAARGTEFCSYHCVVRPLLASPSFALVPAARVTRLRADGGAVRAVEYVQGGTLTELPARAVVLAAGAIDSTVILLRSTSDDFPQGLGNTDGLVGRYLHDHPRQWWTARPDQPMTSLTHPVYIARPDYDATPPLLAHSLTLGQTSALDRVKSFYGGRSPQFGVQVFGTMVPCPDVGVHLGTADPASAGAVRPVISLRYDDETIANLESARARLQEVMGTAGRPVEIPGPFHELHPGSSVHFGGTVRMHADRAFGVLDAWNRVHDVPNLVVADSSCFTTGPEKNPTLTAMALAARAADHLADELQLA